MTQTLSDILPLPAIEMVRWVDRVRGREVATALVGFLLWGDVRECEFVAGGKLDVKLRVGDTTMRQKEGIASGSGKATEQLSF